MDDVTFCHGDPPKVWENGHQNHRLTLTSYHPRKSGTLEPPPLLATITTSNMYLFPPEADGRHRNGARKPDPTGRIQYFGLVCQNFRNGENDLAHLPFLQERGVLFTAPYAVRSFRTNFEERRYRRRGGVQQEMDSRASNAFYLRRTAGNTKPLGDEIFSFFWRSFDSFLFTIRWGNVWMSVFLRNTADFNHLFWRGNNRVWGIGGEVLVLFRKQT